MTDTTNATTPLVAEDSDLNTVAGAFARADKKGQAAIKLGLQERAMKALTEGNLEEAGRWAGLMRDVTTAAEGVASDYEAAQRVATFRAVLVDLEVNLSDRARDLLDTATVGKCERLEARLGGVQVTRTAVSDDGANRAGSDEPKGSVKEALVGYLSTQAVGAWTTIAQAGKWITANGAEFGYTPNYVISGGAILARNDGNAKSTAWRAEHSIEFGKVAGMGSSGPAPVWCVRRTA